MNTVQEYAKNRWNKGGLRFFHAYLLQDDVSEKIRAFSYERETNHALQYYWKMSSTPKYQQLIQHHPKIHQQLLDYLDQIAPHSQHNHTRNTLYNIIKNIVQHPDDKTFTRIKIDVSKFKERITNVSGGMDFLLLVGFTIHQSEKPPGVIQQYLVSIIFIFLMCSNGHQEEILSF
jgi:hypothetical protein